MLFWIGQHRVRLDLVEQVRVAQAAAKVGVGILSAVAVALVLVVAHELPDELGARHLHDLEGTRVFLRPFDVNALVALVNPPLCFKRQHFPVRVPVEDQVKHCAMPRPERVHLFFGQVAPGIVVRHVDVQQRVRFHGSDGMVSWNG